jgi:seryl-tRNA synthetase
VRIAFLPFHTSNGMLTLYLPPAQYTVDQTATKINAVQKQINVRTRDKESADDLLQEKTALQQRKAAEEDAVVAKRAVLLQTARRVGNYVHDSVPVSTDEANNQIIREWAPEGFDPSHQQPLSHHDVLLRIGGYDPARGVKLVGHRGYCLTGYGMFL